MSDSEVIIISDGSDGSPNEEHRKRKKLRRNRPRRVPEFSNSSSDSEGEHNSAMEVLRSRQWFVKSEGGIEEQDDAIRSLARDKRLKVEGAFSKRRCRGIRKRSQKDDRPKQRVFNNGGSDEQGLSERTKTTLATADLVTISTSGSSDYEDDRTKVLSSFKRMSHSMVLPLSPQSDNGEDIMQDLDDLLQQQSAVPEDLNPTRPLSPSNLDSPPDSDVSDGEMSSDETQRTKFLFPSYPRSKGFIERPKPHQKTDLNHNVMSDDSVSDFEEVLSKSTADALQNRNLPLGYDSPESEEDQLPVPAIDCYSGDSLDEMEVNPDWAATPPQLDNYDKDSTHGALEKKERTRLKSDEEPPPSGDLHAGSSFSRESPGTSTDAPVGETLPSLKRPLLEAVDTAPYHVRGKRLKSVLSEEERSVVSAVCFTTHMRNLVEACNDEGFVSPAINLMLQLTTTETYPPADLIHFVLDSVLLDYSLPQYVTTKAYHVLERINRFHPLTSARVNLDWEWISNIISVLIIEVKSNRKTRAPNTASNIGESARERSLQGLKFFEMVVENDLQHLVEGNSDDSFRPFVLERYMVKDIIDWLFQCISCYQPGASGGETLIPELVRYLQKVLSLSCQRDLGDHIDFISHNMVHKLDDWSLGQKSYFVQMIKSAKLAQKLVEVYLETRYEVPSCAACRTESLRVLPSRRLSVAKIFLHHIHQRPLEATKGTQAEGVYFEDEETGERVHPGVGPGSEVGRSEERHCLSCSKRVSMTTEQTEELVMFLLSLLQSFLQCPKADNPFPGKLFRQDSATTGHQRHFHLSEEDGTLLKYLSSHVDSFRTDLLLSSPKLSMRTKLHLRQIALLGEKTSQL